ncbi:MAG: hypothetical protein R6X32_16340 [Chloroflexota bacterium]
MNKRYCTRLQAYVASGQSQLVFHPVTAEIILAGQPGTRRHPYDKETFGLNSHDFGEPGSVD